MRTRLKRARKCPICNRPMRKNGHDRNGRQRWQCDACNATTAATVASRSHASTLRAFLDWLLEAAPQRRLDCDARTFRRRSAWCWQLEPRIEPDGVVHRVVMADGTWVNGWCLLAAVDGQNGEVLAWQWCNRESTAAYRALFEQIAPPDVLVCDGMKGILKACAQIWPNTRVQRCLIHMQRDTRADPTSKPRLQAGRELKKLADMLTRIHDAEAAAGWGEAPDAWHERWKRMLAERTYAKDNPDDPRAATSKGGWWWTHLPLRRAYFRLERLFQDGTLFCFLEPGPTALGPMPRDSNRIEGGLNAAPERMLLNHRGMPEHHMRRACEWLCYMKSSQPDPTHILKEHERHTVHGPAQEHEPDTSQPTLGTGIDWNEFHTSTPWKGTD
ncbi:IS1249 family transposase [Bifidobacterium pseudolongum]|uniref:IS1249 family transposase n=1 Tax=Bifidobacterium pseudolongum TaxID=1694 RepID=UPI001021D8E6|nr:IS1249 family transposase [Bifidobacterium pseudolongum]